LVGPFSYAERKKVAWFKLNNRTGAFYKNLNLTIPGIGSRPIEVSERVAERIRALNSTVIRECDAKGVKLVEVAVEVAPPKKPPPPAPKPAPKPKQSKKAPAPKER
jgi:hypothetical protein